FLISPLIQLLAEWPWFSALGYERVFATRLIASLLLGIVAGGAAFALLYANLRFAQRGIVPNPVVMQMNAQTPAVDVTRLVRRLALPAPLVLALFIGLAVSSGWMPVLQFLNQTAFGVTDPVFGRDLGYYLLTLPIVGGVLGLLMFLVGVALLAVGAVGIYVGVSLLGVVVYPAVVQRLIVAPNELNKETPQLRYHIDATRRAWGLDRVLVRDLSGEVAFTERDIQANRTTIDNVR